MLGCVVLRDLVLQIKAEFFPGDITVRDGLLVSALQQIQKSLFEYAVIWDRFIGTTSCNELPDRKADAVGYGLWDNPFSEIQYGARETAVEHEQDMTGFGLLRLGYNHLHIDTRHLESHKILFRRGRIHHHQITQRLISEHLLCVAVSSVIEKQPVGFIPAIFIEEVPQGPVEAIPC